MFGGNQNRSPFFNQKTSFLAGNGQATNHPSTRNFRTNTSNWSGTGRKLNEPQAQGLINGMLSTFFPNNNWSSKFSQKSANMRGFRDQMQREQQRITQEPQAHIQTIILTATPCMSVGTVGGAMMTTIFSAEDFPALRTPKQFPSVKELWEQAKLQQQKPKKDKPKEKSCPSTCDVFFQNYSGPNFHFITSKSPPNQSSSQIVNNSCSKMMKQRQISECSNDSFDICFTDDCEEGVLGYSDTETDDDDDDEDVTDSDTDDDDDFDQVDGEIKKTDNRISSNSNAMFCNKKLKQQQHINYNDDSNQLDSGFDCKRVHFDEKPPVIHVMHVWNFAYRAARKRHWENIATDRGRFKERIDRMSTILNPILENSHRQKIYENRFSCDNTNNNYRGKIEECINIGANKLKPICAPF